MACLLTDRPQSLALWKFSLNSPPQSRKSHRKFDNHDPARNFISSTPHPLTLTVDQITIWREGRGERGRGLLVLIWKLSCLMQCARSLTRQMLGQQIQRIYPEFKTWSCWDWATHRSSSRGEGTSTAAVQKTNPSCHSAGAPPSLSPCCRAQAQYTYSGTNAYRSAGCRPRMSFQM